MSRSASRQLKAVLSAPPAPTQPFRNGTKIQLLESIVCCGPDQLPQAPGLQLVTKGVKPVKVSAGTIGFIRDSKNLVHTEHQGDPSHHGDENLKHVYELAFSIATEIEYLQELSTHRNANYLVMHNDLLHHDKASHTGRFKPGELVKTKKDVVLGTANNVITLPAGSKLCIISQAISVTGGPLSDTKNVAYEVNMFVNRTAHLQYLSNFYPATKFSLSK